jgi:hypothetical protein
MPINRSIVMASQPSCVCLTHTHSRRKSWAIKEAGSDLDRHRSLPLRIWQSGSRSNKRDDDGAGCSNQQCASCRSNNRSIDQRTNSSGESSWYSTHTGRRPFLSRACRFRASRSSVRSTLALCLNVCVVSIARTHNAGGRPSRKEAVQGRAKRWPRPLRAGLNFAWRCVALLSHIQNTHFDMYRYGSFPIHPLFVQSVGQSIFESHTYTLRLPRPHFLSFLSSRFQSPCRAAMRLYIQYSSSSSSLTQTAGGRAADPPHGLT